MPTLGLSRDPTLERWPRAGQVAILDLEYTAWEGSGAREWAGENEWREIVQVGCVLADAAHAFTETDCYECLVRPERNPVLSDYFVRLTGIEQWQVDGNGQPFSHAARGLAEMLTRAEVIMFNGYDGQILRENCALYDVDVQWPTSRMFNFRPLLAETLGRASSELTSSALPQLAGVRTSGRAHTALDDCRAIAASFAAWRRAGVL